MDDIEAQAAQERFIKLRNTRKFAHISTLANDGSPISSYAPCVLKAEGICVFLSRLSSHCNNLLADPRAGVLLIADEAEIRNPFARQRISYQCKAEIVDVTDPLYNVLLDELGTVHGSTVELLRQLPDFVLFCLRPQGGTYVEGFGRAFELTADGRKLAQHMDEQSIRHRH